MRAGLRRVARRAYPRWGMLVSLLGIEPTCGRSGHCKAKQRPRSLLLLRQRPSIAWLDIDPLSSDATVSLTLAYHEDPLPFFDVLTVTFAESG